MRIAHASANAVLLMRARRHALISNQCRQGQGRAHDNNRGRDLGTAVFEAIQSSRSFQDLLKDAVPSRWSWAASIPSSTPARANSAITDSASPASAGISPFTFPPAAVTARLAVEAASPLGWERWTGLHGTTIGIDRFGASAPGATVFKEYGFTVENVVAEALALVGRRPEVQP